MLTAAIPSRTRERTLEPTDELPFGDFCFSCGNATEGSSYCSPECRVIDSQQAATSPDFSPYLSPLPPLVSSAKSTCSTPPSSATNSPLQSPTNDLIEPPSLDLPPPRDGYYAHSLPSHGLKFPATWTINYQPEPLVSPVVSAVDTVHNARDLSYRRKVGRPHPTVPSPLYFRQKAAAVHSSPSLNPVSPSSATRTPFFSFDASGANIHDDDITDLALPQRQHETIAAPTLVPTPSHCGRPGCVGISRKQIKVETGGERKPRRKSWQPPSAPAIRGFTPLESDPSDKVLLSPRIRTLRTGRSASDEGPSTRSSKGRGDGSDSDSSGDDAHSAFACYLFSHLADPAAPAPDPRGRASEPRDEDKKRSRSVDAAVALRAGAPSSTSSSPAPPTPGRPTRTLFRRGPGAAPQTEPSVERLTSLESDKDRLPLGSDDESASTVTVQSRIGGRARDDTIRASALPSSLTTRVRANLLPGHFISATTDTPSSSVAASPFPSPPATPPTAGRGRSSSSRRFSIDNDESSDRGRGRHPLGAVDSSAATPDPRGRSKLRGYGALHRSPSPSVRKEGSSRSPVRSRSSRRSRSRGRGLRDDDDDTPRVRGRTRERVVSDDYEADDDRGRGRGRASPARGKGRLSRVRDREVVFSGGGYGHALSSDSD
ncbi:hypothetical protein JCM10212_007134 [Sporobolomyces blumeae]